MALTVNVTNLNLKVIFLVHFVFIALSSMGAWSGSAYLFYNIIIILFLIWSIFQPQNVEPVQLAVVTNGIAIILDIILLIMCFPYSYHANEKFSAAMAILHLIVRPFSTILLMKLAEERSGAPGAISGLFSTEPHPSNYEDLDQNLPHSSKSGGYNFESAEQI